MWIKTLWALLGTLGYAMLCRLRPADILFASFGGALAWASHSLSASAGAGIFSYLVAAFCAGLYAEILGAARKRPATVYSVAAVITLVPGGGMYYTLSAALSGDGGGAAALGLETLLVAGCLAAGIAFSNVCARLAGQLADARRLTGKGRAGRGEGA